MHLFPEMSEDEKERQQIKGFLGALGETETREEYEARCEQLAKTVTDEIIQQ